MRGTLAKAHARSGDRIALAATSAAGAPFDEAIADFAVAYSEQNAKDYAALQQAVKDGRIEARVGLKIHTDAVCGKVSLGTSTGG